MGYKLKKELGLVTGKNDRSRNKVLLECLSCGQDFSKFKFELKKNSFNSRCRNCNKTKHGLSGTKIYFMWKGMLRRCYDRKSLDYKNYGGRGITVCDEWKRDLRVFHKWVTITKKIKERDLGSDLLTIDRKNVNGNYEPDNCRFIKVSEQICNTRLLWSSNKSGLRGVIKSKNSNRFEVKLQFGDIKIRKYGFKTKIEAGLYYDKIVRKNKLPQPLNFPNGFKLLFLNSSKLWGTDTKTVSKTSNYEISLILTKIFNNETLVPNELLVMKDYRIDYSVLVNKIKLLKEKEKIKNNKVIVERSTGALLALVLL